jgi:hypothetical protein
MSVSVDLGASGAGEVLLSHVSARAVEAVCLLMIDSLDLVRLMKAVPSASTTVPFAIRARMNETAWLSALKAAGSKLRPPTRTIAIILRSRVGDGDILEPDSLAGCSILLIFEILEPGAVMLPHLPECK